MAAAIKTRKVKPISIHHCFETKPEPFDFVLPGFIAGTVGGLVSPGGVGKSTFALLAAASIADSVAGVDMLELGIQCHGKVAFWAAEDPKSAIYHRLYALGQHLTLEQKTAISGNIVLLPCLGQGADIMDQEWLDEIEESARGARLLILDTLTRFHSLDENTAADAKKIMAALEGVAQRTNCAILYLHHVNKSAAMNGMGDLQQAARGSSVFVDNARWLAFVAGMSAAEAKDYGIGDDERSFYLRFNISKQNYSSPVPDKWLKRHSGGVLKVVRLEKQKDTKSKKTITGRV
jgi:RecA-family ATPase